MKRLVLAVNSLAGGAVAELAADALPAADVVVLAPPARFRHDWQPSPAQRARELGMPTLTPADVNASDVVEAVRAHGATLLLSVYYPQLFGDALLGAVDGPVLNFHPSLLPRHRGTAPLVWTLVEGDTTTGLTVHHVDSGVDTGDVVVQRKLPIHPEDTGYDLQLKLVRMVRATAARLLCDWVDGRPLPPRVPQAGAASVHTSRDAHVNHLDWSASRERIRNIVRALAPPLPAAYAECAGERIAIARVAPADGGGGPLPPGTVRRGPGEDPLVWAADGPLRICEVVAGGTTVAARDAALPADGMTLR